VDGDPSTQKEMDNFPTENKKRFNDSTEAEIGGMEKKAVFGKKHISEVPDGEKIYPSVVNWLTKKVCGVYKKTKCRICFGGHRFDKSMIDCFAPTVTFMSVMMLICLTAMFGWFIGSIDYSQAYLNADLDQPYYMDPPEYWKRIHGYDYVWILHKAIYGHPKSGRMWASCLNEKLEKLGFIQFSTDQCVWKRHDYKKGIFCFLAIQTDDILVMSNCNTTYLDTKNELLGAFEGADQGNLESFCGVEFKVSNDRIEMSMEYYWKKLMERFDINGDAKAPIQKKISKVDCPETCDSSIKSRFLAIVGSILFGFTHARLDIAYAIGSLTRVMHSPSKSHLEQAEHLLRYMNFTKNWNLTYHRQKDIKYGSDFTFYANVDASHADDEETSFSTGGWFIFLGPGQGAVAAKSGLSDDVALSSTESETIWASKCSQSCAYVKQFMDETDLFSSVKFELHEDSKPMINAHKKNVSASKFRHMRIRFHYLRNLLKMGWCYLVKISTGVQTADLATKVLPVAVTLKHSKKVLGFNESDN